VVSCSDNQRQKGQGVESHPYPVKKGQRYINLNPGRLFCSAATQKGKGIEMLIKIITLAPIQQGKTTVATQD